MATIEEEIKQKKFNSEYQKLVVNIFYTSSWLSAKNLHLLKPYGISQEQYNVLRILRGQFPNPCSIQTICDRMIDRSSNASRIVEKLRLKKMLERVECKSDRRLVDITITETGLKLLSELDQFFNNWEESLGHTVTEAEAKELNRILDKLRTET